MQKTKTPPKITLILGSGPDAMDAAVWPVGGFDNIVAINNAWNVRDDWNYLIYPEDFAADRLPQTVDAQTQMLVTADDYVPVQNEYGGFVYAGGTMAFTAGYWALGALKPDVLAFFGCDMHYGEANGKTHFYGNGEPDPLRDDVTLQSLEAKSARLMLMAGCQGCMTVNLSERNETRLVFPRLSVEEVAQLSRMDLDAWTLFQNRKDSRDSIEAVLRRESELGYFVSSGRYWEQESMFDARALRDLDGLWLKASE
ncbi:MAG: hypothetical protein ACRCU5_10790 [Rhizobiaceae bacterium]